MSTLSQLFMGAVILVHCYAAWVEMAQWKERGPGLFKSLPTDLFPRTESLAFNQGVYNLFLVVGLLLALVRQDETWATVFLLFVIVAGVAVARTIEMRPGLIQAVPALIALVSLYLG
ncbi:MAG: DUF1304 domain-containing protein [Pseudomonadota bacterium]